MCCYNVVGGVLAALARKCPVSTFVGTSWSPKFDSLKSEDQPSLKMIHLGRGHRVSFNEFVLGPSGSEPVDWSDQVAL